MIDILFLAHKRPEFTAAALEALGANTDWSAARLVIYTDGAAWPRICRVPATCEEALLRGDRFGGPVAIMHDYLQQTPAEIFAKIDNDTIVPPGWLEASLAVMAAHPELDLLGIEPPESRTAPPWSPGVRPPAPELAMVGASGYAATDAIGGIGLMRRRAFEGRERMWPHGPNGVGGFTDWQWQNKDVVKGWIVPPLKVFLLDRLPIEPWAQLSRRYLAEGVQRVWTPYGPEAAELWNWWTEGRAA